MQIRHAQTPTDWQNVRTLFQEYAASLNYDLCFQSFEAELEKLPTMYGRPSGSMLLAEIDGVARGCVGLRPLAEGVCEMKRLYLQPAYRGGGRGLALAKAILAEAKSLGYRRIRLDTLPGMQTAIAMYRRFGFREVAPYYANPVEGTVYMELDLETVSNFTPQASPDITIKT